MAAQRASSQSLKSIAGVLLVALGLLILAANLDGIAVSMCSCAGISAREALGIHPALGLAALHALQAYTFNHDAFLSGLRQILVSFWPLILVAIGTALLQNALGGRLARPQSGAGSSTAGGP